MIVGAGSAGVVVAVVGEPVQAVVVPEPLDVIVADYVSGPHQSDAIAAFRLERFSP